MVRPTSPGCLARWPDPNLQTPGMDFPGSRARESRRSHPGCSREKSRIHRNSRLRQSRGAMFLRRLLRGRTLRRRRDSGSRTPSRQVTAQSCSQMRSRRFPPCRGSGRRSWPRLFRSCRWLRRHPRYMHRRPPRKGCRPAEIRLPDRSLPPRMFRRRRTGLRPRDRSCRSRAWSSLRTSPCRCIDRPYRESRRRCREFPWGSGHRRFWLLRSTGCTPAGSCRGFPCGPNTSRPNRRPRRRCRRGRRPRRSSPKRRREKRDNRWSWPGSRLNGENQ